MAPSLRIFLLVVALAAVALMYYQLRTARLRTEYALFWILFFLLIVILAAFPRIAYWGAALIGIQTPVIFVFLVILALLLFRVFRTSLKVSELESKLQDLTQNVAIEQFEQREQERNLELEYRDELQGDLEAPRGERVGAAAVADGSASADAASRAEAGAGSGVPDCGECRTGRGAL